MSKIDELRERLVAEAQSKIPERLKVSGQMPAQAVTFFEDLLASKPRNLEKHEETRANYLTPYSGFLQENLGSLDQASFDSVLDVLEEGLKEQVESNKRFASDIIEDIRNNDDTVRLLANVPRAGENIIRGVTAGYLGIDDIPFVDYEAFEQGVQEVMVQQEFAKRKQDLPDEDPRKIWEKLQEDIANGDGPTLSLAESVLSEKLPFVAGMLQPVGAIGRGLSASGRALGLARGGEKGLRATLEALAIGGASVGLYEGASASQPGDDRSRLEKAGLGALAGAGGALASKIVQPLYGVLSKHAPNWSQAIADYRRLGVTPGPLAKVGQFVDLPESMADAAFGMGLTALDPEATPQQILANAIPFAFVTKRYGRIEEAARRMAELRQKPGGKVLAAALDAEANQMAVRLEQQQALVTMKALEESRLTETVKAAQGVASSSGLGKSWAADVVRSAEVINRASNFDPTTSEAPSPTAPRFPEPSPPVSVERQLRYPGTAWAQSKVTEVDRMLQSLTELLRAREDAVFQDTDIVRETKKVELEIRGKLDQLFKIGMGGQTLDKLLKVDRESPMWTRDPVMARIRDHFPFEKPEGGFSHRPSEAALSDGVMAKRRDMLFGEGEFADKPPLEDFPSLVSRIAESARVKAGASKDILSRLETVGLDSIHRILPRFNPDALRRGGSRVGNTPEAIREFVEKQMTFEMEAVARAGQGRNDMAYPSEKLQSVDRRSPEALGADRTDDPILYQRMAGEAAQRAGTIEGWSQFRQALEETVLWDATRPGGTLSNLKPESEPWIVPAIRIWERNIARNVLGENFSSLAESQRPGASTMDIAKELYEKKNGQGSWAAMKDTESSLAQDRGQAPDPVQVVHRRNELARRVDENTRGIVHRLSQETKAHNALARLGVGIGEITEKIAAGIAAGATVGLGASATAASGTLAVVPWFMMPSRFSGKRLIAKPETQRGIKGKIDGAYRRLTTMGEKTNPMDLWELPKDVRGIRKLWQSYLGTPDAVISSKPVEWKIEQELADHARLASYAQRLDAAKVREISQNEKANRALWEWMDGFRSLNDGERVTNPELRRKLLGSLVEGLDNQTRRDIQNAHKELRSILDEIRKDIQGAGKDVPDEFGLDDFIPHIVDENGGQRFAQRAMDFAADLIGKKAKGKERPFANGVELSRHLLARKDGAEPIKDVEVAMRHYLPAAVQWVGLKKLQGKLDPFINGRKTGVGKVTDEGLEELFRLAPKAGKSALDHAVRFRGQNWIAEHFKAGDSTVTLVNMGTGEKHPNIPLGEFKANAKMNQGGIAQMGSRFRLDYANKWAEDVLGSKPFTAWEKVANQIGKHFYHLNLSSLNPKATINNLLGGLAMNFNELGLHYTTVGGKQAIEALNKGSESRKVLEDAGIFADGMWAYSTGPEFLPGKKALRLLGKANLSVFTASEMFNRASGYLGGRQRALDEIATLGVSPEWRKALKRDGVPQSEWTQHVAHREGIRAIGRAASLYSVGNAPAAFRSNPAVRLALHLQRFTFQAMNETIRSVKDFGRGRPERLLRQMAGIYAMKHLGDWMGLDFNFSFSTEFQDLGLGEYEVGDTFPELRGFDEDEGTTASKIGAFEVPIQTPFGPGAPIQAGMSLIDMAISTMTSPDDFQEDVAHWWNQSGNRIRDQLVPFYKVARTWSNARAAFKDDPEKGFNLEASGDPQKPFKITYKNGDTHYLTTPESLMVGPFFTTSETRNQLRLSRYNSSVTARSSQTRAKRMRAARDLVEAWQATGDESYAVQFYELIDREGIRSQDVLRSLDKKDDPSWFHRGRGTNSNFFGQIYRRWKHKLATDQEILNALSTISDFSMFTDEEIGKLKEVLEAVN